MENKETSIQWLMSQAVNWARNTNSGNDIVEFPKGAINQAKAMHKEEIENAFVECWKANMPDGYECKLSAKEYYNETFGGNNEQQ